MLQQRRETAQQRVAVARFGDDDAPSRAGFEHGEGRPLGRPGDQVARRVLGLLEAARRDVGQTELLGEVLMGRRDQVVLGTKFGMDIQDGKGLRGSRHYIRQAIDASLGRLRTVLVTGEIALALFLLVGTGLLVRGIFLTEHQNLGFHAERLLTA